MFNLSIENDADWNIIIIKRRLIELGLYREKIIKKTRIDHYCSECPTKIPKGSETVSYSVLYSNKDGQGVYNGYYCSNCKEERNKLGI